MTYPLGMTALLLGLVIILPVLPAWQIVQALILPAESRPPENKTGIMEVESDFPWIVRVSHSKGPLIGGI